VRCAAIHQKGSNAWSIAVIDVSAREILALYYSLQNAAPASHGTLGFTLNILFVTN
jgi:hypothetical protein